MSTEMSYSQALTEAKQVIIQQQYRIKADAEKSKAQQQTILDQSASLSENERRLKEQSSELERLAEELNETIGERNQATTAKEQAEAIIDRQGERITGLQSANAELERQVAEQSHQIADLTAERDSLLSRLPTQDDIEALQAMADLLSRKNAASKFAASGSQMRMAPDHAEAA